MNKHWNNAHQMKYISNWNIFTESYLMFFLCTKSHFKYTRGNKSEPNTRRRSPAHQLSFWPHFKDRRSRITATSISHNLKVRLADRQLTNGCIDTCTLPTPHPGRVRLLRLVWLEIYVTSGPWGRVGLGQSNCRVVTLFTPMSGVQRHKTAM